MRRTKWNRTSFGWKQTTRRHGNRIRSISSRGWNSVMWLGKMMFPTQITLKSRHISWRRKMTEDKKRSEVILWWKREYLTVKVELSLADIFVLSIIPFIRINLSCSLMEFCRSALSWSYSVKVLSKMFFHWCLIMSLEGFVECFISETI